MTHSLKELALLAIPHQGTFSLPSRTQGKVNPLEGMVGQQP